MRPTITWIDGKWIEGNAPIMGAGTHAVWLSSVVFDGARGFDGVAPDLTRHSERVVRSAKYFGMEPGLEAGEIEAIAREGLKKIPADRATYIRPLVWAEEGWLEPDPASTRFALSIIDWPMPEPTGAKVMISRRHRRPNQENAPTQAKASCLYPQSGLAIREAKAAGFADAVMLDSNGNVSEFTGSNLFLAKDGEVVTPVPNGTFLAGVTRRRVIDLLGADGLKVSERSVTPDELAAADEIFSTGNFGKVLPITGIDGRDLQPGPVFARARRLYWDWAHSGA